MDIKMEIVVNGDAAAAAAAAAEGMVLVKFISFLLGSII
jgi:hypothetical protein